MALAVVTGASGFIGTHLVAYLRSLGWNVLALTRRTSKTQHLQDLGATVVPVDVVDRTGMRSAVPTGVDVLFHLACAPFGSGFQPDYISRTNEDGLRNALFAATEKKTTCAVYMSDAICFGDHSDLIHEKTALADPKNLHGAYARSKRECEAILGRAIARGLDAVSVMPSAVIGAGLRPYRALPFATAMADDALCVPSGGRSFVDVDSLVRLLVKAAERGMTGQRYLVGGPYQSWTEIVQRFADVNALSTNFGTQTAAGKLLKNSVTRLRALTTRNAEVTADAWLWSQKQQISAQISEADLGFEAANPDKALTELYDFLRQS